MADVSLGTDMVATESRTGEWVVATSEGSSPTAVPSETTESLCALLSWAEVKSKRGQEKKYPTAGYACLNPACKYYGIIDERQALVGHTTRGKDKDILYLWCQCCKKMFSSRKGTPLVPAAA